jgi:Zn-dependent alcohol dehydrogenase
LPQTVQGVIARAKGAPVEIVDIVVPDPGPGEAVVRVDTCGVCHTDLHYREGGINAATRSSWSVLGPPVGRTATSRRSSTRSAASS